MARRTRKCKSITMAAKWENLTSTTIAAEYEVGSCGLLWVSVPKSRPIGMHSKFIETFAFVLSSQNKCLETASASSRMV